MLGTKSRLFIMEYRDTSNKSTIEPLPVHRRPCIAFRVEASDGHHFGAVRGRNCWYNNQTSLRPRASPPWRQPSPAEFRSHLKWDKTSPSPFVSFSTTWKAALKRRALFLRLGATKIDIFVVWVRDHQHIYDAREVASKVGCSKPHFFYKNEVLLLGGFVERRYVRRCRLANGMDFDPYSGDVLVVFTGRRTLEEVEFHLSFDSSVRKAFLPVGSLPPDKDNVPADGLKSNTAPKSNMWRSCAYARLRSLIEFWNPHYCIRSIDFKTYILVLALSMASYQRTAREASRLASVRETLPTDTSEIPSTA